MRTYQVWSSDSDVDNIGDGFSGVALPFSGDQLVAELLDVVKNGVHFGRHILPVNNDRGVGTVLQ